MQTQLPLFADLVEATSDIKTARSGTFLDNMSLPIHRWFRYSAGFSAEWVQQVLKNWQIKPGDYVLDPFVGSGTVPIVCDSLGVYGLGVEAHPIVARICKAKFNWNCDHLRFGEMAAEVLKLSRTFTDIDLTYPPLIERSYSREALISLHQLKQAWLSVKDSSPESELIWLALTAILRPASKAGTAQWQYILPNKTKKNVLDPRFAFQQQVEAMKSDMLEMQKKVKISFAQLISGDARLLAESIHHKIDAVITSPPYANNYDYADALRFEMTFWGNVSGWGDLHDTVRKYLIVSSSQHASKEKIRMVDILASESIQPIRTDLSMVMDELARVRENHGGKKHYHTMIGAYFRDISLVLQQLRLVCSNGAHMCWVIGDSAPYGVYCPVDRWIGDLALAAGFKSYRFDKLRDRNIKWKNRKHTVPLKEGLLWIEG